MTDDTSLYDRIWRGRISGSGASVAEVASIHDPLPPRRPIQGFWDFVVRGYRPVGLWVLVAILFVHGVVLPIAALLGHAGVTPLSGPELVAIITLVGLGWHQRTKEKREGITS